MSASPPIPGLESIFEYLALLVAEQPPDEPFLLRQLQPAVQLKFPTFSFAAYGLANLRDFLSVGEQAGYFRLVNTGDAKTVHLLPGERARKPPAEPMPVPTGQTDPRRIQWMTQVMEDMLSAERADQIMEAARGSDALSIAFSEFLAGQERSNLLYPVRGKLRRVREFLAMWRTNGETPAMMAWQPSRALLKMPPVPPQGDAPRAGAYIQALLQGRARLADLPIEHLDNTFFGVLRYYQQQFRRERAFDYVAGLEILEAEARAVPRPAPPPVKRGLFGGGKPSGPVVEPLDGEQIEAITRQLLNLAGVRSTQDLTAPWRAYMAAQGPEALYSTLASNPRLLQDDAFLNWMDAQIGEAVERDNWNEVSGVANKAALVIAARQVGLDQLRANTAEIKGVYDSILAGARQLGQVVAYLKPDVEPVKYLHGHPELIEDENIGLVLDDQLIKAAERGDVARYRTVSARVSLWRGVSELGMENGVKQYQRAQAAPREDRQVLAEMGFLLLQGATDTETRRDILERFPAVVSNDGLALANNTLEMLSFQGVDQVEYARHFEIKRLIERCLELGINRALAELK
ncbi:MAG: hypothetical protein IT323_05580 [Anaerolineae bacterium]|nr:hypothetical protein [Anaerolineae bacterium]